MAAEDVWYDVRAHAVVVGAAGEELRCPRAVRRHCEGSGGGVRALHDGATGRTVLCCDVGAAVRLAARNFEGAEATPRGAVAGATVLALVDRKRKRVDVMPLGDGGGVFRLTPVHADGAAAMDARTDQKRTAAASAAAHRADLIKLTSEFGTQRVQRALQRAQRARVEATSVGATCADAKVLADAARRLSNQKAATTTSMAPEAAGRNAPAGHDKTATTADAAYPANGVLGPALAAAYAPLAAAIKKAATSPNPRKVLEKAAHDAMGGHGVSAGTVVVPDAVLKLLGAHHARGGTACLWLAHLWSVLRLHAAAPSRGHTSDLKVPGAGVDAAFCAKRLGGLPVDVARDLLDLLRLRESKGNATLYTCPSAHAALEMTHALVAALGATMAWALDDLTPVALALGVSAHTAGTLLSNECGAKVWTQRTAQGGSAVSAELLGARSGGKALGECMRVPRRAPARART